MGAYYRYCEDYTIDYKDALSGQGSGYFVWRNKNEQHFYLKADISVGNLPKEGGDNQT